MSYKTYSMELAGRTLSIDIGRVAKQANGAALMHYGDTTVYVRLQHPISHARESIFSHCL